ncbi:hypothetical protein AWB75_01647 [Caballeronia catudaia]|uniref:Uncharacterized protein n=1 Tax=Caballeronia catudaia TaxID=1777136 RepID=A0A158A341_9BURK|nr:hypothetical protein [Caballeronia catudaia]SAK52119.1 hypothetical protein AWB75_01647 [Caballeronia catudaia]
MNRPEYSLSLDAVICRRCSTVSPIEESHCPSCGADRQGAIFTSNADATAAAPMPAPLDILDLSDSGWLQRLVRRKMLTTYPNFVEPGDLPDAQQRKPARTGIAVLLGSVVASIAAGGYFYSTLDGNLAPATAEPGISAAGSVHDGASGAEQAPHAALIRSRADSTTAHTGAPASTDVPKASPAPELQASAAREVAIAARSTIQAAPPPSRAEAQVAATVFAAPAVPAPANVPAHDIAPSAAIVATKPAPATTTGASVVAAAPSIKQAAPIAASAQRPEARESTTPPVAAKPMTAQTPQESATPATAKPVTQASAQNPTPRESTTLVTASPLIGQPATQAPAVASVQKPEPLAKPMTPAPAVASQQTSAKGKPTTASLEKPAAPAPIAEPLPAAVAHSIAAVQQALAGRDLTSARRHMRGLYASLPRSPEIQQLAADLSRQERARDSAMASARSCAANKDAACALRHARRAVALDPRNAQAQSTLRRALAVQNETNSEYFRQASAIPQPTLPAMTFDGRWSAGTRHGPASGNNDASNVTFFGWGVPIVSKGRGDAH